MSSAEDIWILFKCRHLQISYARMPRDAVRFSSKSEGTDWREKLKQSEGQSCDLSKKIFVYGWQDVKDRHEIIGIIPCVVVASLETDAFVSFASYIDMLMARSNLSARSKKKVLKEQLLFWGKKSPRLRISKLRSNNSSQRKAKELGMNASAGHTMKFLGCIWYETKFGKEKGNLKELSKNVNFMSEILARPVLRNEHLRKPH